jgi:hypothetical protein
MDRDPRLRRFHLAAAAHRPAEAPDGLNIEGLAATPAGSLLIGFRNPLPGGRALARPDRLAIRPEIGPRPDQPADPAPQRDDGSSFTMRLLHATSCHIYGMMAPEAMPVKRTTIYLPDDVHRALRREALEQDVTMAEIIRRMSEFYLQRDQVFWRTVARMRAPNAGMDPAAVDRDVMEAVRGVRQGRHAKKRASR